MKTILLALLIGAGFMYYDTEESVLVEDYGKFSAVEASTSVEVIVHESSTYDVKYKMIKGSEDKLIIENKGGVLKIKIKNSWGWGDKARAKVDVYAPSLQALGSSAGASLRTDGVFKSDFFDLDASSGSSLSAEVISDRMKADVSSGANMTIQGSSEKIDLDASSGASLDASRLKSRTVKADASSGSLIKLWCTHSLEANASSGASVRYKGNPKEKEIDRSSGGNVSPL